MVGSLLITLLRHADRVAIACLAQLVNVIAPILTEPGGPAWRQTIFHPFALTARLRPGHRAAYRAGLPRYETARYGDVPVLDAVALHDEESGELTVFAVNRGTADLPLDLDLRGLPGLHPVQHSASPPGTTRTRSTPRPSPTG